MSMIRRALGAVAAALLLAFIPAAAHAATAADAARPAGASPARAYAAAGDGTSLTGDQAGRAATAIPSKKRAAAARATWYYYLEASCRGYESSIASGANYWGGAVRTASSGTPVGCTSGYITTCGIPAAVGCNWNRGQRIMLSTRVRDFALLSAHEFGHNWYDHSAQACANWNSPYDVMKTTMC